MKKYRFKKLLNLHETITHKRLMAVCQKKGAKIFSKVRIADILPIENSGINDSDYRFAMLGHFDFVVTDSESEPLFAVEFDGPHHDSDEDQKRRDAIKDNLVEFFNFPMLRVRSTHLQKNYDGWDLLSWIVDVWFIQQEVDSMYAAGELPYDFDFDPAFILSSPDRKRRFPYWLGLDAQLSIKALYDSGQFKDMVPSMYVGYDENDTRRAMAFIRMDDTHGVYVKTAMRRQNFQIDFHGPILGILFNDIYEEIKSALADPTRKIPLNEIDRIAKNYSSRYRMGSCSGYSGDWNKKNE